MAAHQIARPFQRWIFASYARPDQHWMERLCVHLKPLKKSCGAEFFRDVEIDTGEDWDEQIRQALRDSNAAVLLISADFLASPYISDNEFPTLLARTKEDRGDLNVFPVFVSPCCYEEVTFEYTSPSGRRERRSLSSVMAANDPTIPLVCQTVCQQEETLARVARRIAAWFRELDHSPVGPKPALPRLTRDVNVSRMPRSSGFFAGRGEDLKELDEHFESPECAVYVIVAQGGEGKSALASHWLRRLESHDWYGARAFAWSFYSQGTREVSAAADDFIFEALTFFGDQPPHDGPPESKGKRLAELIQAEKTVLILDGLEPLQNSDGNIQDDAVTALVTTLGTAPAANRLCVITTRQPIPGGKKGVDPKQDGPAVAGLQQDRINEVQLSPLNQNDGARLLRLLGVPGSPRVLRYLSTEVCGHPLSLLLMGTYKRDVGDDCTTGGDSALPPIHTSMPAHVHLRIMAYETYFEGQPHRDVLRILGLFDRPAAAAELAALRAKPIAELTDRIAQVKDDVEFQAILDSLRRAGLVSEPALENPGGLDTHPLIREYFAVRLRTSFGAAWKAGHDVLYRCLGSRQGARPDTLREMIPLYQAMHHAALADQLGPALKDVYWQQIQRGKRGYSHRQLGAFQSELNMLRECFDRPWTEPKAQLSPFWSAHVLGIAGSRLRALGKLNDATMPLRSSLRRHEASGHFLYAAIRARHLCELNQELGHLEQSLVDGEKAVKLANQARPREKLDEYRDNGMEDVDDHSVKYERMAAYTVLGAAQHQLGNMDDARKRFERACDLVAEEPRWGTVTKLFGLWGFRYCEFLIDEVRAAANKRERSRLFGILERQIDEMRIVSRADIEESVPEGDLGRLGPTLVELVAIRAWRLAPDPVPYDRLIKPAKRVSEELRQGRRRDFIPLGILNYVQVTREYVVAMKRTGGRGTAKDLIDDAKHELDNAERIAQSGGMELYKIDCLIERAWLLHLEQQDESARDCHREAEESCRRLKYGRRTRDVDDLRKALP